MLKVRRFFGEISRTLWFGEKVTFLLLLSSLRESLDSFKIDGRDAGMILSGEGELSEADF